MSASCISDWSIRAPPPAPIGQPRPAILLDGNVALEQFAEETALWHLARYLALAQLFFTEHTHAGQCRETGQHLARLVGLLRVVWWRIRQQRIQDSVLTLTYWCLVGNVTHICSDTHSNVDSTSHKQQFDISYSVCTQTHQETGVRALLAMQFRACQREWPSTSA